ncbi:MAG TPA: GNAT family N-acetyltransferase [Candidatus Accumulibacter phosphatis]|nr:MAG: Acetyltransferase Pat [Candidatus Accumulibacter sp. SK-11]HAY28276.1 N-acetyltransferase [Accumulibacter sp.]HCN69300.1 N-acetyltransferase [Accumulibacter sp.]HRL74175.1 GNAT family N-acetyltransferase [Candidatus Accumulibacter phosphatis]HRQ94734.1 GNAT family N-acetyltransferase [Candidatus Accumulibacter phosphatis]
MADYPAELVRTRHLFDGTEVLIRPIRPDDAPMEQDFVQHLSADSRYRRFMSTLKELPLGKLKYLTEIDYVRHLALVAIIRRDGHAIEIGVARYVAGPLGSDCEFAIAIDDEWQGSGVAGILMLTLIDAARARGMQRMEAFILAANDRMIKFARQLGFTVRRDPDDPGIVRAERSL